MKIMVMCPGSFTSGLDSAERGESRWSQNYAKMLAMAGHDVYAGSMGLPEPKVHYGVKLVHETKCKQYEPFDLYIDSSWWKEKVPYARSKKYLCLKWSLEDYTREFEFPDNFYLGYPYPSHMQEFYISEAKGSRKTFALPTMFGTAFPKPNWDKKNIFLPGKIDPNRNHKKYIPAIAEFMNKHPVTGCSASFFQEDFKGLLKPQPGSNMYELAPFDQVMKHMGDSKLSLPILNPGCIIEAAFAGTPSIFWENGGFYNPLAQNMGVSIPHDAEPEVFTDIAERMMSDKKLHWEVTRITQDYFSYHLYSVAIEYFNMMIETIF